jgi:hypothetical protein
MGRLLGYGVQEREGRGKREEGRGCAAAEEEELNTEAAEETEAHTTLPE